mgnify:CR=1 FL=1
MYFSLPLPCLSDVTNQTCFPLSQDPEKSGMKPTMQTYEVDLNQYVYHFNFDRNC